MPKDRGQATIETVALLPVLAVCALGAWQVLVVAWALLAAGDAAHAGARALLSSEPAKPAIRRALPGSMRSGVDVEIGAGQVRVTVRVPSVIPGFAPHITAIANVAQQ
jgi:TadE-like protein